MRYESNATSQKVNVLGTSPEPSRHQSAPVIVFDASARLHEEGGWQRLGFGLRHPPSETRSQSEVQASMVTLRL
jgi:hypothetical protein